MQHSDHVATVRLLAPNTKTLFASYSILSPANIRFRIVVMTDELSLTEPENPPDLKPC